MRLTDRDAFLKCLKDIGQNVDIFKSKEKDAETYFQDFEFGQDIREYNPENLPDIKESMKGILNEEIYGEIKKQCMRILAQNIMAFSLSVEDEWQSGKFEEDLKIPEFIYVF